ALQVTEVHFSQTKTLADLMSFRRLCSFTSAVSHQLRIDTVRNMATGSDGAAANAAKTNRLANEKSPYLLQHATNPVDWYPWGEEAFKVAKEKNKLIFLSVGYSTCHWCHVMERESFENHEIAKVMNEHFINIKVDREERPDVDKVYMTFVTSVSGSGGWPMSVWLTPTLQPVYGGTYFPPTDRYYGQPGFLSLLKSLGEQWGSSEDKFVASGSKIMEVLDKSARLPPAGTDNLPSLDCANICLAQLARSYESEYGGFGESPKFPQPSNFNFIFTFASVSPELDYSKQGLNMALHSLTMMAQGGIHDHVGQGFHRYSTDRQWHVPHFEKMLYDQAQLTHSYLDAFLTTSEDVYKDVVVDILTYVNRDLSHPSGGVYSAEEDADSLPTNDAKEKKEGAFCVWTNEEVNEILSETVRPGIETTLADVFSHHYSVVEGGNVNPYQDPHEELKNQNVLMVHGSVEETAQEYGLTHIECEGVLQKSRDILYKVREKRPRPHRDEKMLTSWNGMIMGAFARAGAVMTNKLYVDRAVKVANFIKENLYHDGQLYRVAYPDNDNTISLGGKISGFTDDYAWVVRGLIHLYEATLDCDWLIWAEKIQDKQNELFWDSHGKGYYMSKVEDSSILLKLKEDQDGAEPSGNSVSAGNLTLLGNLLERKDYKDKAKDIFSLFADRLAKIPIALPEMTTALLMYTKDPMNIILSGNREKEDLSKLLSVIHRHLAPNRTIMLANENVESFMYKRHAELKNYHPRTPDAPAAAYVCSNFVCSLPVTSPEGLQESLKKRNKQASSLSS
ncbi:unnamed protein product, partial [Meganyctiphanes norvegica]